VIECSFSNGVPFKFELRTYKMFRPKCHPKCSLNAQPEKSLLACKPNAKFKVRTPRYKLQKIRVYDFLLGDQVFSSLYKGVSCTFIVRIQGYFALR
jgi:hypothetical protein